MRSLVGERFLYGLQFSEPLSSCICPRTIIFIGSRPMQNILFSECSQDMDRRRRIVGALGEVPLVAKGCRFRSAVRFRQEGRGCASISSLIGILKTSVNSYLHKQIFKRVAKAKLMQPHHCCSQALGGSLYTRPKPPELYVLCFKISRCADAWRRAAEFVRTARRLRGQHQCTRLQRSNVNLNYS